ncbi:MAG: SWIM zinc finger family protein [Phycisphaeraceae bacterium]|nr:SWIM zinc finger family protein [Phycisphaeraceae bacterium]
MSLIKIWAPHFQSGIRMRGRAYQAEGRVKRMPPQEGELIRAEVRGKQTYTVVIRGEGSTATAECNCAFFAGGSYCKHIWATILDANYNPLEAAVSEQRTLANEEDQPSLRVPKARKRDGGAKTSSASEPEWVGRLSLLRMPVSGASQGVIPAPPTIMHSQVCYSLSSELSSRYNGLVVLLRQRDPTQTGWSRLKRLKITGGSVEEIQDSTDRELCALVWGATPIESEDIRVNFGNESMRDAFRLPRGAGRALLKRMVDTGRCFLDGDLSEPEPLRWGGDEPWVLWMIGIEGVNELVVTTELRRTGPAGEERSSIEDPDLIVSGADGVVIYDGQVAPFDDRGAARWAGQFRDDYRHGGRSAPIRVPAADVPRFLDRLYRLTNLPEIELPDGVGRREQHVAPIPHLEIFGPDAHAAALGGGTPRSQLVARLSFAYEDSRVRPGLPGRYVPQREHGDAAETDDILATEELGSEEGITTEPSDQSDDSIGEETKRDDLNDPGADLDDGGEDSGDEGLDDSFPIPRSPAQRVLIRRDPARENEAVTILAGLGFRHHPNNGFDTMLLPARQMVSVVSELLRKGWVVSADQRVIRYAAPPRISITSGVDWFEMHGSVKFDTANGEQIVGLPEVLAAMRSGKKMITLGDGSEGLLPEEWLEQQGLLAAIGKVEGDHIRFKKTQAALLDTLLGEKDFIEADEKFQEARRKLRQFSGIQPIEPAATFKGTLRPYQCEGLGWLAFLRWFGMGGVLADDMGLGKTIQVLAMLDARYGERATARKGRTSAANSTSSEHGAADPGQHKPSLIIVPRSVVFNWIDEAQHFAPNLRVQAYTGTERNTLREAFVDHDVIVTSYGLMRRDINELRKHAFDYVVLDEAQAIKNPTSQSAKAARLLEANHRLALTGTPVENHLGDLWSIFEFLNPGMLGSNTKFGLLVRGEPEEKVEIESPAKSAAPVAQSAAGDPRITMDPKAAAQIARALRPFILRRTKKQVLSELPEKTEQTIVCQLEPEQKKLYEQLRQHYRGTLLNKLESGMTASLGGSTMMVLEALLRLRQAACHPGLIDPKRADEPSAKLEVLLDRLADIIEEGHKALVFSQFTSMLALVRRRLDERKIVYEYLDGQTRHRKKHVQRFQTDPACPLFLISLKAGGLGLNLTAAEYVFILDPWWNPAVEAQAIDRIHRIGQTRHVFAYRLICEDTVEQRIAQLQEKKKKLADAIVGGQESLLSSLTRADLEQLLS